MTDFRWFAVFTQTLREQYVASLLRNKGYTAFVPLYKVSRRWSDRLKEVDFPLFPAYLFCQLDPDDRMPILSTPGVKGIVGIGKVPTPVCDSEVEAIRTIVASGQGGVPWNFLQTGVSVRVDGGPLRGLEGILVQIKSQYRVIVSVTLLQRSVAVEVDLEWVRPIRRHCRPVVYPTAAAS
ncbi:MAG TPA: UpxY family transcription antiterminator [Bryobacteraceae bacterium]|nr:UpxY family transcription antiterminator [Bryobacteraceae bacterium]